MLIISLENLQCASYFIYKHICVCLCLYTYIKREIVFYIYIYKISLFLNYFENFNKCFYRKMHTLQHIQLH